MSYASETGRSDEQMKRVIEFYRIFLFEEKDYGLVACITMLGVDVVAILLFTATEVVKVLAK